MNNEKFDYYNNTFSYMKIIMKNLNSDKKNLEVMVIKSLFNDIVEEMDSNKIYEMIIISSLFEKKINSLNENEKRRLINDLYSCYIKSMIVNYVNNEMTMVKFFFDSLYSRVLDISGFYGVFGDNIKIFRENVKKMR